MKSIIKITTIALIIVAMISWWATKKSEPTIVALLLVIAYNTLSMQNTSDK